MTNPDDAAFVRTENAGGFGVSQVGLTKREYFAAMAMQGFLATGDVNLTADNVPQHVAQFAVLAADALIAELNKEKSE